MSGCHAAGLLIPAKSLFVLREASLSCSSLGWKKIRCECVHSCGCFPLSIAPTCALVLLPSHIVSPVSDSYSALIIVARSRWNCTFDVLDPAGCPYWWSIWLTPSGSRYCWGKEWALTYPPQCSTRWWYLCGTGPCRWSECAPSF